MAPSSTQLSPDADNKVDNAKPPLTSEPLKGGDQHALKCDSAGATACYANFCRVTGTPEELIIDFGLNAQPMGVSTEPIEISERIVLSYFTAKRMLAALQISLQRHEAAFGVLETNVQKRLAPGLQRQA